MPTVRLSRLIVQTLPAPSESESNDVMSEHVPQQVHFLDGVVLITHADCDDGGRRALRLVAVGYRVAVTARHAGKLARLLAGQSADRVVAIAADPGDSDLLERLVSRIAARLGEVRWIVDGRTGAVTSVGIAHPLRWAS